MGIRSGPGCDLRSERHYRLGQVRFGHVDAQALHQVLPPPPRKTLLSGLPALSR